MEGWRPSESAGGAQPGSSVLAGAGRGSFGLVFGRGQAGRWVLAECKHQGLEAAGVENAKASGDGERRWSDAQRFLSPGARSGKAGEWVGRVCVASLSRSALNARRAGDRPGSGSVRAGGRAGTRLAAPRGRSAPAELLDPRLQDGAWRAVGAALRPGNPRNRRWGPRITHPSSGGDRLAPRGAFLRLALPLPPPAPLSLPPAAGFLRAPYLPQNSPGPRRCLAVRFPPGRVRSTGWGCESRGHGGGGTPALGPGPPVATARCAPAAHHPCPQPSFVFRGGAAFGARVGPRAHARGCAAMGDHAGLLRDADDLDGRHWPFLGRSF